MSPDQDPIPSGAAIRKADQAMARIDRHECPTCGKYLGRDSERPRCLRCDGGDDDQA